MNIFKAGFARVVINPALGTPIGGYYIPRTAEHILDDLEINALAMELGEKKIILVSLDQCGAYTNLVNELRELAAEAVGVPVESIFLTSTHSHTTPVLSSGSTNELVAEYCQMVRRRMVDVCKMALEDLKPARMGWGVGQAPNVAFIRRYRMKDGSVRTNPGVGNPDALHSVGDVDERVNVLRFDREGGDTLVLVNVGNHPDTIGGNNISADWPGFMRRTVEKSIDNTRCIFFNGAEGDVNHVNVFAKGGDWNDLTNDFDDVPRGYGHARHMGRVVAAGVLQVYDKVNYVEVNQLDSLLKTFDAPSNMPAPEELELARKYNDLHNAGKDDEIPFEGMQLTTAVADAARKIRLEHGPEAFPMMLTGIAIGPVAMLGVPGEPFNGVGLGLKKAPGWDLVLPCCQGNGREGYFPMMDAYIEGGYEAVSSSYKAGIAELIIDEGIKVLNELKA